MMNAKKKESDMICESYDKRIWSERTKNKIKINKK